MWGQKPGTVAGLFTSHKNQENVVPSEGVCPSRGTPTQLAHSLLQTGISTRIYEEKSPATCTGLFYKPRLETTFPRRRSLPASFPPCPAPPPTRVPASSTRARSWRDLQQLPQP